VTTPVPNKESDAAKAAMAEAVGIGGAEMGQRSARVTASSPTAGPKKLTTEAISAEGTWMPTFGVQGLDVSSHQTSVDWQQQWNMGARFAYVKASEGNYYTSPTYDSQYQGSRKVGMIRGAYHFAIPNWSSGADQARYFVQNGGGWTADGYTMPPVLDFEFNPYEGRTINGFFFGNTCYGMSPAQLTTWVRDFGNTMLSMTGRLPAIYTNTSWWRQCLGDPAGFGDYPLWVAAYPSSPTNNAGPVPASWSSYSIWQYSSTGPFAGDSNVWNGDLGSLQRFAGGFTVNTGGAIGQAWLAAGGVNGAWGKPTSFETCNSSICQQTFEQRMVYWTAARGVVSVVTSGAIGSMWRSAGAAASKFGLPVSNETCTSQYCVQNFETGDLYWSASTGAQPIYSGTDNSTIGAFWKKQGGTNSKYGLPTTAESCTANYCAQYFERGAVFWTAATGIQPVFTNGDSSTVGGTWMKLGGINSKYKFPIAAEKCYSNYCEQLFENGRVVWSAVGGVQPVYTNGDNSTIGGLWVTAGAATSRFGFPMEAESCATTSCQQRFQFGSVVWSAGGGTQPLYYGTDNSTIAAYYTLKLGGTTGKFGFPTSSETCQNNACMQKFQYGSVVWSAVGGIQPLYYGTDNSTIAAYYTLKLGGATGKFGFPTSSETCQDDACMQKFQYGTVVWSAVGGIQPLYYGTDNSTIAAYYTLKLGGATGKFGFPTSSETCQNNACMQKFQYGNVYWSAGGGIQPVWTNASTTTVGGYYESLGGPVSLLTYPASAEQCKGIICYQRFLAGYVTWSAASGLQTVNTTKEIGKAWLGQGGVDGALGVPRDREQCSGTTSCTQAFVNGTIRWSLTGGISIVKNT
jgi:uncharacterized protein with LGFP repeats/GH25 family lysozyme M1 (1,4-beta-N-acetylmuramidase)